MRSLSVLVIIEWSPFLGYPLKELRIMSRAIAVLAAVGWFCWPAPAPAARPLTSVVPQQTAQRYGLERSWATQIELDRSRGRVAHISLQSGLLMVQTDQAAVHVLDAETRKTLWIGHVGLPGAVSSPPAANEKYVVSSNGGMLYLFDRATGKVLWARKMVSVPSAGAAISKDRIYVPLVTGMVTTYRLPSATKRETPSEQRFKDNASNYMGKGIAYLAPIVTRSTVVWGTDKGNIYGVAPDTLQAIYRFKARDSIMAGLMYRPPYVFAASRDGYIYALREGKGTARWQFSIGNPIVETPMATDDGVYVIPEIGGLYKLALDTGEEQWSAPGVFQFISASPTRLYTADSAGRLLILNAKTGTRLGAINTENLSIKVFNRDNDRVYLATTTGLVQCLHEVGLKEPAWHGLSAASDSDKGDSPDDAEKKEKKEKKPVADDGPDPFGADEDMPAKEDDEAMDDEGDAAMEDEK
jgi:outer membrane protein assembly factor BamB